MRVPDARRSRLGYILCLVAILAQVLALPLHERQIGALTASGSPRAPVSTLPLGGHDDSSCIFHAAAAAAHAAAPAERVAIPAPQVAVEPQPVAGLSGFDERFFLPSDPRAPPALS
jgi:hypothetical protein